MHDVVPGIWLLLVAGGAAVLGAAIAYGVMSMRKWPRERREAQNDAVHEVYEEAEAKRRQLEEGSSRPRQAP